SVRLTRETRWDTVRSPHIFMGLLAAPDPGIRQWCERLQTEESRLLAEFQEMFFLGEGASDPVIALNREVLSDNALRLRRAALQRAGGRPQRRITPLDLLISLLTASNSVVAECFERLLGVTAAKLTELAVKAEQAVAPRPEA